jgi:hypothetical protein
VPSTCNLKGTATGYHTLVNYHVVNTPQTVAHGVLDLRYGVGVGSFDEKSDRLGVFDIFLLAVNICACLLKPTDLQ